ncbi:transposase [Clostridium sp. BJN0013]|uniref:transposase n=1 Tax=Clostridium sp. BJN0013 TaxID=3236840 RepID=UPI0034C67196
MGSVGTVNPKTGDLSQQLSDKGNTENFKYFFYTVSKDYSNKKVIIIADNIKHHHFKSINKYLEKLKNIEFFYLPLYCSELNAVEHL